MTKLLKYIKASAIIYTILAPLMMFIEVIMDLNQPKLMSDIIDIGVANGDITYVLNVGFKMIVVALWCFFYFSFDEYGKKYETRFI